MEKQLVMYSRTVGCPFVSLAKRVLQEHQVAYQEIFIDLDAAAKEHVLAWTGFLSVPTLVVAHPGELLPVKSPAPLDAGASPRGIDRGSIITEPNITQFIEWLQKHGFIQAENITV